AHGERGGMTPVLIPCSQSAHDQKDARGQATILLARRAPTIKRWSLDARSEGRFAYPLWRR
ncbi:MAG: hypothetical protein ACREMY_14730, partial [bacterium]